MISDIDPLWSPTMTPQQGRFPDASKDLPADLPFSPYSASLFSSATQATGLPGFGTTDQIDNHRDFVADLTRDDFFDYRSSVRLFKYMHIVAQRLTW
jgi:hypothetical protein